MKVEKGGFLDVHVAFRGGIQKVHARSHMGRWLAKALPTIVNSSNVNH